MSLRLRGGGAGPPVPETYGPSLGAQSVRDGAGTRTVTDPGGGYAFSTVAQLTSLIASSPANSIFVGSAGLYSPTAPLYVNAEHPRIYFLPGAIIDGGSGDFQWLNCNDVGASAGAEVHGGLFRNFGQAASASWLAALIVRGDSVVADAEFSNCYYAAFYTGESNTASQRGVITHCYAHDGLRGSFLGVANANQTTEHPTELSYCHIEDNNTLHFDPGGATGEAGFKFLGKSPWLHHNWVERTWGPGLWTDGAGPDVLIEENVIEGCTHWGIFYELSGGTAESRGVIRHNALYGNATHGTNWFEDVQVLASCIDGYSGGGTQGFEIASNYIDGTQKALALIDHTSHPYDTRNGWVHDNALWLRGTATSVVGAYSNEDDDIYGIPAHNRFEANHYHVTDTGLAKWHWAGTTPAVGTAKTWAQWQAYGHDLAGSLTGDA